MKEDIKNENAQQNAQEGRGIKPSRPSAWRYE